MKAPDSFCLFVFLTRIKIERERERKSQTPCVTRYSTEIFRLNGAMMWDDHRRSIHKMTSPLLFSSFSIIGRNGSGCVVVPTSGSHLNFLLFFSWNRLLAQVSLSLGSFVARQDSLFHSKFFSDYAVVWLLFCFLFSSSFKGSC